MQANQPPPHPRSLAWSAKGCVQVVQLRMVAALWLLTSSLGGVGGRRNQARSPGLFIDTSVFVGRRQILRLTASRVCTCTSHVFPNLFVTMGRSTQPTLTALLLGRHGPALANQNCGASEATIGAAIPAIGVASESSRIDCDSTGRQRLVRPRPRSGVTTLDNRPIRMTLSPPSLP